MSRRSVSVLAVSYVVDVARQRPRLTGVSGMGLGAQWEWLPTDAEIVRRLIVFLEDRRALSSPSEAEVPKWVVESVLRIREELTKTLQELAPDSGANRSVWALRAACLTFLERVGTPEGQWFPNFPIALGELRGVFAIYVRMLADYYGITVHGPLAEVLRAADLAGERAG